MCADSRVQTDTVYNGLGVKTFHLGVCVEFIEITYAEREVGVGEELYGLGFGRAHEQHRHVLLDGAFVNEVREGVRCFLQAVVAVTDNDSARIEIVVQCLGFSQEFRCEEDFRHYCLHGAVGKTLPIGEFFADGCRISHRYSRFDDHDCFRVHFQDQFDDLFHV